MFLMPCSFCGRHREHCARGLCQNCYNKAKYRGLLAGFAKGRRAPRVSPDRSAYWHARYLARKGAA